MQGLPGGLRGHAVGLRRAVKVREAAGKLEPQRRLGGLRRSYDLHPHKHQADETRAV